MFVTRIEVVQHMAFTNDFSGMPEMYHLVVFLISKARDLKVPELVCLQILEISSQQKVVNFRVLPGIKKLKKVLVLELISFKAVLR